MAIKNLTGAWGEMVAGEYLRKKFGWRLIGKNYTVRGGEIDLIAETRKYIVFAEVKTRKNAAHGEAKEFVTPWKQERIRYAAECWLAEHETNKQPRFDVIEVYAPNGADTEKPQIIHLEDAF